VASDGLADLPLRTVWVEDATESPAVLLSDRSRLSGTLRDGALDESVGILDEKLAAAGTRRQSLVAPGP